MTCLQVLVLLGWLVATILSLLVVYGLYGYTKGDVTLSVGVSALYNAVNRTVWGFGLCWVIFACVTGHGGAIF